MRSSERPYVALAGIVALSAAMWTACNREKASAGSSDNGKVPVTTKSEDARKEFLQGRDLCYRGPILRALE